MMLRADKQGTRNRSQHSFIGELLWSRPPNPILPLKWWKYLFEVDLLLDRCGTVHSQEIRERPRVLSLPFYKFDVLKRLTRDSEV